MPRFEVGDAVVHVDEPTVRGSIVTILRGEDPVEYRVRWSGRRVPAIVAESALVPALEGPDDLDERELEDEAGSLD
jgi:hypothetical protein